MLRGHVREFRPMTENDLWTYGPIELTHFYLVCSQHVSFMVQTFSSEGSRPTPCSTLHTINVMSWIVGFHVNFIWRFFKLIENIWKCWTLLNHVHSLFDFGDFVCFGVVPLTPMSLVHQVTQTFHVRRCGTSTSTLVLRTWPGSWLQNLRARFVLGFEFETVGSQHVHFFGKQEMSCDSSGLTFHGSNPASAHNIINTCARAQPTPFRKLAFAIDECWIHMNHMNNTCPVLFDKRSFWKLATRSYARRGFNNFKPVWCSRTHCSNFRSLETSRGVALCVGLSTGLCVAVAVWRALPSVIALTSLERAQETGRKWEKLRERGEDASTHHMQDVSPTEGNEK